ncbi:CusA/CzcA family heavy metal efflux RND transporter [bacterium]|nr:CusA/CzcA family heavy metal efflux RND transporter [bacterium]MBU1990166.1 CusA/CzcA family heavy metal efflux RND transporter [bacterium]
MLHYIVNGSLKNRLLVLFVGLAMMIWGFFELQKSTVDIFPDLTAPTVTVLTEAQGMTSLEVERLITVPLENGLNGLSGLRRIRSNSLGGISVIYAEFEWDTNIYLARQLVSEKLQTVSDLLPKNISSPVLAPISSIMGEIMFVALHSKEHTSIELKSIADWQVRQRLLSIPGIAEVIPIGGDTKQFQVLLKVEKLSEYDLSVRDVIRAIKESNSNSNAGFYTSNSQEFTLYGVGRIDNLKDISNTFVKTHEGNPVLISDIAKVQIGASPKRGIGSFNSNEAVVLAIQKQPKANTLQLTHEIESVLEHLQQQLPKNVNIETDLFKQSYFIENAISNLSNALRDGAILVVLVVLLFLLSGSATIITLTAIPLSLFFTVFLLNTLNISINTMTLGGMAIALGVLVDDAIIVVENIIRRLQINNKKEASAQESRVKIIAHATLEIQSSIVFATLIILLVFLPLFFLEGIEGRLMAPLGLAYISSLIASLVVALTITPVLSYYFLKLKHSSVHSAKHITWLMSSYEKLLHVTIDRWKALGTVSIILFCIASAYLFIAGKSFLPEFNEGSLTVSVVSLPGTSLEVSGELGGEVESALLSFKEVVSVTRRTGRGELDPHAQGVHASEMEVTLSLEGTTKQEFLHSLREKLSSISGVNITIGQPISHRIDHMLSGSKAAIALKVFGENIYEQRKISNQLKEIMESVDGTVDVMVENQSDLPQLTLKFKRDIMASYGLSVEKLGEIVQVAFYGLNITKVIEGSALYDVALKYDTAKSIDLTEIKSTMIKTASGIEVPLDALVDISYTRMPYMVSREGVERKGVITANVAGRDLVSVVNEIKENVDKSVNLPKGYRIEYGGQFESAQKSTQTLLTLGGLIIIGIFLLLFTVFKSFKDALVILINLPLALIGGVIGLYFADGVISVATLIGFITLFGIATRNGVMMIAHIQNLIQHEDVQDFKQAVIQGAKERLIPIMMTALAAGLAMVPLALGMGEAGSEIQAPMAIVILFGLLSSTILNMIVVPAVYFKFGNRKN